MTNSETIIWQPIGRIYPEQEEAQGPNYKTPHQGRTSDRLYCLRLHGNANFDQALTDLQSFSHIWVLFAFHEAGAFRPMIVPPRGAPRKRGLFATRAPLRPCPIGQTAVELVHIDGLEVHVRGGDFREATPLLDIKPYIPDYDCIAEANRGWLAELEQERWRVEWQEGLARQLAALSQQLGFDVLAYACDVLSWHRDKHPYRRISRNGDRGSLAIQHYRVHFTLDKENRCVRLTAIESSTG